MPRVHAIGSTEIWVYFDDTKQHRAPHFHAVSPHGDAVLEIPTLNRLAGNMKVKTLNKVIKWAEKEEAALLLKAKWNECNPRQPIKE